jgi:hypothetical protein
VVGCKKLFAAAMIFCDGLCNAKKPELLKSSFGIAIGIEQTKQQ